MEFPFISLPQETPPYLMRFVTRFVQKHSGALVKLIRMKGVTLDHICRSRADQFVLLLGSRVLPYHLVKVYVAVNCENRIIHMQPIELEKAIHLLVGDYLDSSLFAVRVWKVQRFYPYITR
jgi:hypothetical protein